MPRLSEILTDDARRFFVQRQPLNYAQRDLLWRPVIQLGDTRVFIRGSYGGPDPSEIWSESSGSVFALYPRKLACKHALHFCFHVWWKKVEYVNLSRVRKSESVM